MSNPKQPNVFYMGVFDLAQNDGKSINEREVIRKILELKQMPFDSSKEAFHDHMDMFFMAKDA